MAKFIIPSLGFATGLCLLASSAIAMPESCEKEFGPMMAKRQSYINQINGFQKRKPTASQACGVFRNLAVHNDKMATWMTAQKEWCQLPEEVVKNFTDAQGQIVTTRNNVCNAAAKQAQQIKQMQRQQQRQQAAPAGGGAGSGVRLPQGAL